jgi:hypothetical protein
MTVLKEIVENKEVGVVQGWFWGGREMHGAWLEPGFLHRKKQRTELFLVACHCGK